MYESQTAVLAVVGGTAAARERMSQTAVMAVYAPETTREVYASQFAALVPYEPGPTRQMNDSQVFALVPYAGLPKIRPRVSQAFAAIVYGTGQPVVVRSRAWSFSLDGHVFYVLDLGDEGTFLFDQVTGQWCEFRTNGYVGWNMKVGTTWGENRVAGADSINNFVWELDPDQPLDEEFRDKEHFATGGVQTRSRVYMSVEALRLAASVGQIDDTSGAVLKMRFSDDNGQTWSNYFEITLTSGDYSGELSFRSLGSFMAPGRVFEISDVGGLIRIDGADVFIGDFDGDDLTSKHQRDYLKRIVGNG